MSRGKAPSTAVVREGHLEEVPVKQRAGGKASQSEGTAFAKALGLHLVGTFEEGPLGHREHEGPKRDWQCPEL